MSSETLMPIGRTRLLTAAIVLAVAAPLMGVTYTVPLCSNRPFTMGHPFYYSFDLGTPLASVQQVQFSCSGTITAGLGPYGQPYGTRFLADLNEGPGYWLAIASNAGQATWPAPEPFSGTYAFSRHAGANWSILLDGRTSGYIEMDGIVWIPEEPPPISFPSGTISAASLIIEATPVPEPGSALLVLIGGLGMLMAGRRP